MKSELWQFSIGQELKDGKGPALKMRSMGDCFQQDLYKRPQAIGRGYFAFKVVIGGEKEEAFFSCSVIGTIV